MADLIAYLKFPGNCREAMTFYKSCLGGEVNIMTISESPMKDQLPGDMQDKVMHAVLNSSNMMLMGSDLIGDDSYDRGNDIALCLVCKNREEFDTFFAKLSQGGQVTTPVSEMFFGTYGELLDKYGFKWMFQYGEPPT